MRTQQVTSPVGHVNWSFKTTFSVSPLRSHTWVCHRTPINCCFYLLCCGSVFCCHCDLHNNAALWLTCWSFRARTSLSFLNNWAGCLAGRVSELREGWANRNLLSSDLQLDHRRDRGLELLCVFVFITHGANKSTGRMDDSPYSWKAPALMRVTGAVTHWHKPSECR